MNIVFKIVNKNGDVEWRQQRKVDNVMAVVCSISSQEHVEGCVPFVLYDEYEYLEKEKRRLSSIIERIKNDIERIDNE
jgi:hypothetical protein